MYWLNWAVTVGVELTTVSILMKRWFPDVSSWIWCVTFAAALFLVNALSAKAYAEAEFWFASVKSQPSLFSSYSVVQLCSVY